MSFPASGERFRARYRITGSEAEARRKAEDICLEQTVELPLALVPEGPIREHVIGRIEALTPIGHELYEAEISFAIETAGGELPQLLNVLFGNISIKPGIRLEQLELSATLLQRFRGPRFGQSGLRGLLGVYDRPLLMTALKPMGSSPEQLAELAYRCARSGVDIVKDDHGLANQPFATFAARVARCAEAVAKANAETGAKSFYAPSITAPATEVFQRAYLAKEAGAGGLLVCPALIGFDTMRALAEDDTLALPIISHPSFTGAFVTSPTNGISHYVLYGQLQRLAGADASIYPNVGGRFGFSVEECRSIVAGCVELLGSLAPAFPTPGGGMRMHNLAQMWELYGDAVIYLIGGGLREGGTLEEGVAEVRRQFATMVSHNAAV